MTDNKTKIMVLGATGYVGLEVCRQLVKHEKPTIAHIRPDSNQLGEWRMRFEAMGATIDTSNWMLGEMKEAFLKHRPDIVFILIGTTQKRMKELIKKGYNKQDGSYEAIDYGLTALAINAIIQAGLKSKIIYLSSIGTKQGAKSPYLRARFKAEQSVIESGLPYKIVRAPIISGPDRMESRIAERIAAKGLDAVINLIKTIAYKKSLIKYISIDAKKLAAGLIFEAFDDSSNEILYVDAWR